MNKIISRINSIDKKIYQIYEEFKTNIIKDRIREINFENGIDYFLLCFLG